MHLILLPAMFIPPMFRKQFFIKYSKQMLKSVGDKGHPCRTPLPISLPSDISSPILTFICCFIQRLLKSLLSFQSTPIFFRIPMSFFLSTLSNAFSRSTNSAYTSLSFSMYLSPIVRINPIASLVPFPFLKPNCYSSNSSSILEGRRRFNILRRIFPVCDILLRVQNSLNFFALFFFSIGSNTVSMNSSAIDFPYQSFCMFTEFPSSLHSNIYPIQWGFHLPLLLSHFSFP